MNILPISCFSNDIFSALKSCRDNQARSWQSLILCRHYFKKRRFGVSSAIHLNQTVINLILFLQYCGLCGYGWCPLNGNGLTKWSIWCLWAVVNGLKPTKHQRGYFIYFFFCRPLNTSGMTLSRMNFVYLLGQADSLQLGRYGNNQKWRQKKNKKKLGMWQTVGAKSCTLSVLLLSNSFTAEAGFQAGWSEIMLILVSSGGKPCSSAQHNRLGPITQM